LRDLRGDQERDTPGVIVRERGLQLLSGLLERTAREMNAGEFHVRGCVRGIRGQQNIQV
jgi:hypothetical protein